MRKRLIWSLPIIIALAGLAGWSCAPRTGGDTLVENEKIMKPAAPVAEIRPHKMDMFGDLRIDNYYWLKDRTSPEVLDYLKAENAYTDAVMKQTEDMQTALFEEMKSRIKETDLSVPVKYGDYFYYSRTEEGKQYKVYCRKPGSLEAGEEILLDENQLAEGSEYFEIGEFKVSPDHKLLAYSVDLDGGEEYTVYFKNLETGELYPEQIEGTYYSLEWANDNKTVFYTTVDEAMRPYRLYRHVLGTDPGEDVLVYEEVDDSYFLSIQKSKSQAFLFLMLGSQVTTEVRYLMTDDPKGSFEIIHPRQYRMEYYPAHHEDKFFILTNDNALNFKLMAAPVSNPTIDNWTTVIEHRDAVILEEIITFRNHLVVVERDQGLRKIRVRDFESSEEYYVDFPEATYKMNLEENPEFNTGQLRFKYSSFITPNSIYDYNMSYRQRELQKQDEVLGGYDPTRYETTRVFATSVDGKQIPISIVYRRDMIRDGSNPVYLYGYGSYGYNTDPRFNSNRFSLIDRGFIFAVAHIRGSSYLGRGWYEDGKLLNKKNTYTDFISCAEYLVENNYTNPKQLVAVGGSAGGLLMGAVSNLRPDLFKVIVADVPFVDVITTMLDESIPLTVIEYDEWGNPNDEEFYWYMKDYSPYDQVAAKDYPNLLITAGLNDPRVQYWEPAKWTAKLRAAKTDNNRLLLKTNMGAGHGGASGRYDYLKEVAFEYAFILDLLGIE